MSTNTSQADNALWPLSYVIVVACMGLVFGFDLGTILTNRDYVSDFFLVAASKSDIIVGTFTLGFVFGVFIAGYITYGSGRKISIISSVTIGTLAILASTVSPNISILLCAQFVVGFAFGIFVVASYLYICELVLPVNRGRTLMLLPISLTCGCLLSLSAYNDLEKASMVILLILVLLNLILTAISVVKLPESPRYLALSGNSDAALAVLFKLRHDMGVAARELARINECSRGETRGIEFYLQNTIYRRLLSLICILTVLFNGAGVILLPYSIIDDVRFTVFCPSDGGSTTISNELGLGKCIFNFSHAHVYITFIVCLCSALLFTILIDKVPRRRLLLGAMMLSSASMLATTLITLFTGTVFSTMLNVMSFIYIFFSFGAFVVFTNVLAIELLPIRGREFGVAAIFMFNGIGFLLTLQFYLPLLHYFGTTNFFFVLSVVILLITYVSYLLLPAAGANSLEFIESRIMATKEVSNLIKVLQNNGS